jgi:BirA family transcriptional regulator, biotin operon repressor / biotin---[acetyl-CoA-carboxylase] ligase
LNPPTRHLHWDAEGLWLRLRPLLPDLSVEVVARTDSTNTRLLERARHGSSADRGPRSQPMPLDGPGAGRHDDGDTDPATAHAPWCPPHGRRATDLQPCLLVAEHQTQGRGRLGRDWQASPGLSLTFSLALPYAPAAGWSGLSLAVGLALAEALEPQAAAPRLRLKRPNDLWLADDASADALDAPGGIAAPPGRKLGGILLETLPLPTQGDTRRSAFGGETAAARWLVVGVGLNVRPQPAEDSAALASGHASLQALRPDLDAPATLHAVAVPLVQTLLGFARDGFAPLQAAYARRDLLAGRLVSTTQADCPQGLALGVDAEGALRVQTGGPGGTRVEHRLLSGEVSVRPLPEGRPC